MERTIYTLTIVRHIQQQRIEIMIDVQVVGLAVSMRLNTMALAVAPSAVS